MTPVSPALTLLGLLACGGPEPVNPPAPVPKSAPAPAPQTTPCDPGELTLAPPTREAKSPLATEPSPELVAARKVLIDLVRSHARDPENPWAVGHGMLALGGDVELTNGKPAVDWLLSEYAVVEEAAGAKVLAFPPRRGAIRIEPHTDLLLKAFTESGQSPTHGATVDGEALTLEALYRGSLCAAWVDGDQTAFDSWNDAPWALQALSAWAPEDLSWTATGGHEMTMDAFASAAVAKLGAETAFLHEGREKGTPVRKRKQGIFAYTCGGAHLVQGAAWAVGRGFGTEADRAAIQREVGTHLWRMDIELSAVDALVETRPEYAPLLLVQRMKFLGHALETAHKAAAMGLYTPTSEEKALLDRAASELAATVLDIEKRGYVLNLKRIRAQNEQTYLDYVGDAAHAIRGIDLHTGEGVVRY